MTSANKIIKFSNMSNQPISILFWINGVGYGDYLEQLSYLLFLKWQRSMKSHLTTAN
jgi:hypothetical protein